MIYNYPKEAKPFYARQNDDGTVAAFDLVVPKVWSEVCVDRLAQLCALFFCVEVFRNFCS